MYRVDHDRSMLVEGSRVSGFRVEGFRMWSLGLRGIQGPSV